MAGLGKSSRLGKRASSSSSSSYISMVIMVIFVAFCLLAIWMLTSSSSITPSSQTSATASSVATSLLRSRAFFYSSTPPPSLFLMRDPGDLPNDDAKPRDVVVEEEKEEVVESGGKAAVYKLAGPVVLETNENDREDSSSREDQENGNNPDSQGGDGAGGENQEQLDQHPEQEDQGRVPEEESHQDQQAEGVNDDNEQQQSQETGGEQEEQGNGADRMLPDHNTDPENDDADQQQLQEKQSVQLEEGSEMESRQQQNDGETDEKQEQPQQQETETGGYENQLLQQPEADDEENQPQLQKTMEEEVVEGQEQSQQQTGTGESSENREEVSQQQKEEEEVNLANEESQQQGADEKLNDDPDVSESLPEGTQSEVSNSSDRKKMPWSTQADQSENEKERHKESHSHGGGGDVGNMYGYKWKLCNVTAGTDYIPCLDNEEALRHVSTRHYEHRERHCPKEGPTCLVPLPQAYRRSIEWPKSRDRIWYNNVPRTKLAVVKGHQNWVKVTGQYLTFPGGGTQFIHGALHYIDFIQKAVHNIAWGKRIRVVLDVGSGVASFGGYLFDRDVLTMSFAPKDEHEAQIQFALERGIPAISAVMGSQRLPFPSRVFDVVHCARCRVPWHAEGGTLLLELNRLLRPGGYFVWSATPVYQKLKEDVEIWKAMTSLTISMCWDLFTIKKDRLNSVGAAIYRKPISNECYDNRKHHSPPMCKEDDDPNAAWYIPLQSCMHRVPTDASERGSQWPEEWPRRLHSPPYWLNSSQMGVYGKPAPDDFTADYKHWQRVVTKSYLSGLGISWSKVRNIMDMRAVYGGFAAVLRDLKVWVMNVVNIDDPDTLPIIYERGLFGIYHDWCESFSTYPRTYDLLHADHLFSRLKKRCNIVPVMVEVDRILRPGGKLIVRDESSTVSEVENLLKSLHWEVRLTFSKGQEGILCAEKSDWRPETLSDSS